MSSDLIPTYYLTHETPAGTRYAYPRPARPQGMGTYPGASGEWMSPDAETVIVPIREGSYRSERGWIVADAPLRTLVLPWRERLPAGDWTKRPTAPDDPVAATAWQDWPDYPSDDLLGHVEQADDYSHCTTCSTFRAVYGREERWADHQYEVDTTSWLPLPGAADPSPETAWVVADTSHTALYGSHTDHLWPGEIPGFREAVNKALEADRRTQYVWTHAGSDRPSGSTEVVVPILWEVPKVERRRREGVTGRKLRGTEEVRRPIAADHRIHRIVPKGLTGRTKAEALAGWDAAVAAEVDAFMPPGMRACNNCDGHGFVFAGGAS